MNTIDILKILVGKLFAGDKHLEHPAGLLSLQNAAWSRAVGRNSSSSVATRIGGAAAREFGGLRGAAIAERVLAAGKPLTVVNLLIYYDLPTAAHRPRVCIVDGWLTITVRADECPFLAAVRGSGLELSALPYCAEFDRSMVDAYNPDLQFEHTPPGLGGSVCVLKYKEAENQ